IEAANGKELVEQLAAAQHQPDVCILDIQMGPMNGYETAKFIRQQWPSIKMIALTMFDEEFSMIRMLHNGTGGYLTKDCDLEQLAEALEQVYETSYYHTEIGEEILLQYTQGKYPPLTDKELEFLRLCSCDLSNREIGKLMAQSERTVEKYRESLCKKLNIKSRTGLAVFAMRTGLDQAEMAACL
ncbi:MAG: response regulator transcription factor, partial [Taibaiella sp.]|nr:response regulator transcription factor [Taibaiella sp.]